MKLEDIWDLWEADGHMDMTELSAESLKIPLLHHKYYRLYIQEVLAFRKYEQEYKTLYKLKHEYYTGVLDKATLEERGWEPNPLKILRQDMPVYMESDPDIQLIQVKIDIQKQKVSFLESAIKTIVNRGFLIKNVIDWERFKSGA